ncbi:MAG TPA: hypothetical protein VGY56_10515 [Verrucomicrobiae bacterium]|nr:hypothetical protein [Verrucomicrobiae bacterium]
MKSSRVAIWRMNCISFRLRAGLPFNLRDLARKIEVGEKTLRRDMEFMRNFLGYDVRYSQSKRTWTGKPPRERIL